MNILFNKSSQLLVPMPVLWVSLLLTNSCMTGAVTYVHLEGFNGL